MAAQKKLSHKVVKGESIYSIAKKYNCSEEEIYELNPKLKGKSLQLNTVVLLPNNKKNVLKEQTHIVSNGESFFSISKKYDLKVTQLQKLNPDINPKKLQKGIKLNLVATISDKIKTVNTSVKTVEKETQINNYKDVIHCVEKGETLKSLAKKHNTTVKEIQKLNPTLGDKLSIGFSLIVNKEIVYEKEKVKIVPENKDTFLGIVNYDDHVEEADDSGDVTHLVTKGETLYSISKKYNLKVLDLKKLNPGITENLSVGNVLLIKKNTVAETPESKVIYTELEEYVEDLNPLTESELSTAEFLITKASEAIGTRYRSGGTSIGGFDCSGLMLFTFNEIDLKLPRTSAEQSRFGKKVKKAQAQKGDLIFFTTNGRGNINHVGMITDVQDGVIKFIHASVSRGVIISSLEESYYARRFVKINRVIRKE